MVVQRPKVDDKKRQGCARQSLAACAGAAKPSVTTTASVTVMANSRRASRAQRVGKNATIRRRRRQPVNLNDVKVQRQRQEKRYVEVIRLRILSNVFDDFVRLIYPQDKDCSIMIIYLCLVPEGVPFCCNGFTDWHAGTSQEAQATYCAYSRTSLSQQGPPGNLGGRPRIRSTNSQSLG